MNKILIHSNNTSFNQPKHFSVEEQYFFDVPLDVNDVDIYIDGELKNGKLNELIQSADVVFIKVALSDNYLEYLGIRLAYHLRLTKSLGQKSCLPIVFIAEESFRFLGMTADEPSILFTEGIYLIKENEESYQKLLKWYEEDLVKPLDNFQEFIKKINIKAPSNHLSHHSIANEWSILRWAKVLNIQHDDAISGINQNVEGLLYYKFLQCKFPIETDPDKANYRIEGKGTILYIDDEWNKGWSAVLNGLFNVSPELAKHFHVLENNFKDQNIESILRDCKTKVQATDPDLIILDLRLSDQDFNHSNITLQFSGYKALQLIKDINPGIRVVLFTASNKVWNLIELQSAGADGFILKESPELAVTSGDTKETIRRFVSTIQEQLRYKFEKPLFDSCSNIKKNLRFATLEENEAYKKFIKSLTKQLEVICSSIGKIDLQKKITLDIVFLACYNFLELFKDYYLKEGWDYRFYLGHDELQLKRYKFSGNFASITHQEEFVRNNSNDSPSWFITMAGLFIDYFGVSHPPHDAVARLKKISEKRNDYIHGDKLFFEPTELVMILSILELGTKNVKE